MKKSQACSPSGARSSKRAVGVHLGAERAEGVQVRVEPAAADHVAAGRRHVGLAEARQQRAGEQEGGADALGQAGVDLGVARSRRSCTAITFSSRHSARAPRCTSSSTIASTSRMRGTLRSTTSSRRQQRGGERGQRGVLVAGGDERPGQGRPAFDDELLHARIRPGTGFEAGGQGYRRPSAAQVRAGRPDTLHRVAAFTRRSLGAGRGMGAERVAAQAPARRRGRRWSPTRASGTRTRSCTPPPACCTTSTTSATPTSTPAIRARRWSCSRRRATRRS